MIVRWGLELLSDLLRELSLSRPLLVTTRRFGSLELPIDRRYEGVLPHADVLGVRGAAAAAADADGLVALGGGSAIDTAKAVSAARGLPVVSIPTTYSGAEWTDFFGVRDAERRVKGGGSGACVAGIVYEPRLTLDLPRSDSGGTALNALAHCAEGLYATGRGEATDREALAGARLISDWLPPVLANGRDLEARTRLLEGAMHAGAAMRAGMGLAHAMAQALGGRFGLPHGAMNALCLPVALRFNREAAGAEIERLAEAMEVNDAVARAEELARLAGFVRLRDFGVPEDELVDTAEAAAVRPAARANPRPAGPAQIADLYRSIW